MKTIGWIGTGIMGLSMASNLRKAGYELVIYSRTKEKATPLLDMGATWAQTPREVAEKSDYVFSIVGFPHDVEEVMIGENGALAGLKKGGILCDMTTSCPKLAARIAAEASNKGCFSMDAPVTGGDVGAKNATLSIFVGGAQEGYEALLPCFEKMGKTIVHCGEAGMGQKGKLANQIAIAGVTFSVCESLLFAKECGLDVAAWHKTVVNGAAGSTAMKILGPRIIENNFAPGFFVEHFYKDLKLCIDECRRMGLVLPGLAMAEQTFALLQAQGYGKDGTHALLKGLAQLSAKQW